MPEITSEIVREQIYEVKDPELDLSVMELGLIYDVRVSGTDVEVEMTLTSPACPAGPFIQGEVRRLVSAIEGVGTVTVRLVWEPPWDPRTMASEDVRLDLDIW